MEGLPLSLLLEDLDESEKETLCPGVSKFPSEVLGRCQRCDMFASSLEWWGSYAFGLPREIAQFRTGRIVIVKVSSTEEIQRVFSQLIEESGRRLF